MLLIPAFHSSLQPYLSLHLLLSKNAFHPAARPGSFSSWDFLLQKEASRLLLLIWQQRHIFRLFQFTTVITGAKKLNMLLPTLPGSSPHPKFPKAVKFETSYVQKLHDLVEFYSRPSPIVETLECNAKNHVHVHCINYSISSWAKGMAQSVRKHTVLLIRICTRK